MSGEETTRPLDAMGGTTAELALIRLVAVIDREVETGETDSVETAFAEIRRRTKEA